MTRRLRISRSDLQLDINFIASLFEYRRKAIRLYFSRKNPDFDCVFIGYREPDVIEELKQNLEEIEKDACLNLLAAIEAVFRIDYAIRCEDKKKDAISRYFRELFSEYQYKIPLDDILFTVWKENIPECKKEISSLKSAFKYRHWLAHGRYWTLKAERQKFDFFELYNLAVEVKAKLPLLA